MNEKPIERLNVFNGQKLETDDIHLLSEYQTRVRRWLNKSLYSAGIAKGLEVRYEPGRKDNKGRPVILVADGLALDHEGWEMILVEEAEVPIIGRPNKPGEPVQGNYLYIQYHEEMRAEESGNCAPRGNGRNRGHVAWGGPSRVRATPILGWSDKFPHESSGKVVLAQVELDERCQVRHIHTYVRRYIGQASNAMVRQYALEGERHIDKDNPGRIYFHIRGRQPNAVTLYLRAEIFSTLYYSELGKHDHSPSKDNKTQTSPASIIDSHVHTDGDLFTGIYSDDHTQQLPDGGHQHIIKAFVSAFRDLDILDPTTWIPYLSNDTSSPPFMLRKITQLLATNPDLLNTEVGLSVQKEKEAGDPSDDINFYHQHNISGNTGLVRYPDGNENPPAGYEFHKHGLGTDTVDPAGVDDKKARSGKDEKALTFVNDLQVYIGQVDVDGRWPEPGSGKKCRDEILTQLKDLQPTIWGDNTKTKDKLGDGSKDHPLANNGTGAIRLDLLPNKLNFPEGQYYIDLIVEGDGNGGRILYNLYVE